MGEATGLEDVVGDENDGRSSLFVFFADDGFNQADVVGVEVGGWLVEKQDLRPNGEGADEGQPLGLTGGEGGGRLLGKRMQAHTFQPGVDFLVAESSAAELEAKLEIGGDSAAEEVRPLEDSRDFPSRSQRRKLGDKFTIE